MTNTRGSNLICLRSRDLSNTNLLGNNGRMVLQSPIEANDNERLYVCVLSATFPNSWYNLSSYLNNNTISFKETNDNKAFVLGFDEIMGKDASVDAIANEVLEAELQGQNGYTVTFAGKQAQLVREFVGSIVTNSSGTISLGS